MTELENHLLNALTRLEQQFNEQHKASEQAQSALQTMFECTSQDHQQLQTQVNSLSIQLQQLEKHYSTKRR